MSVTAWKSEYPIRVVGIELTLHPRRLDIRYRESEAESECTLGVLVPREVGAFCDKLDDCYELRIVDTNSEDGGQRNFGRYRLELWDEDNAIAAVLIDGYEV